MEYINRQCLRKHKMEVVVKLKFCKPRLAGASERGCFRYVNIKRDRAGPITVQFDVLNLGISGKRDL